MTRKTLVLNGFCRIVGEGKLLLSPNIPLSGSSINVTRVARVLASKWYFVYCASYETSFTLLNWNISYISGHIRLETGCSFIKMHERTASWIAIEGARRRQRRLQQLTIPDQGISTLNFLIMLIVLFWSQKLKRHLLLQAYINMQRRKKRFIFAF